MFFRFLTSVGRRKRLSTHEESNLRPSDLRSDSVPLSHKDSSVSGEYNKGQYTACITKVDWCVLSSVKN